MFVAGGVVDRCPLQHRLDVWDKSERIQALHERWSRCCRSWRGRGCASRTVSPALWSSERSGCRRSPQAGPSPPGQPREKDLRLPVCRWCQNTAQDFLLHCKGRCVLKRHIKRQSFHASVPSPLTCPHRCCCRPVSVAPCPDGWGVCAPAAVVETEKQSSIESVEKKQSIFRK